jgi:hypothetical protein
LVLTDTCDKGRSFSTYVYVDGHCGFSLQRDASQDWEVLVAVLLTLSLTV